MNFDKSERGFKVLDRGLNKLKGDLEQFFEVSARNINSARANVARVNEITNLKQRVFKLQGTALTLRGKALELKAKMEHETYTALELDNLAIQVVELRLDIDELRREISKL